MQIKLSQYLLKLLNACLFVLSKITVYSDMVSFSVVYKYQHIACKNILSLLRVKQKKLVGVFMFACVLGICRLHGKFEITGYVAKLTLFSVISL